MFSRLFKRLFYKLMRPNIKLSKADDTGSLIWLENLKGLQVKKYIKKENRYTTLQLLGTWRLQRHIQPRIDQLEHSGNLASESIEEEEQIHPYVYYQKSSNDGLPSLYRKHVALGGEVLVFDQNEVGKETGYIQLNGLKISPCNKYLAAVVKTDVSDASSKCYIYNIKQQGPVLMEKLPNVINAEWCNDHDNLVITKGNDFGVPRKVKRFSINKRKLLPLMQEDDVRFQIDILKSRDGKFIIAHSNSKRVSEIEESREAENLFEESDKSEAFEDDSDDPYAVLREVEETVEEVDPFWNVNSSKMTQK